MSKKKLTIAIIFGGQSPEHEVSLISAASVIKNLDRTKYKIIPIGITKEGKWIASPAALSLLKTGSRGEREPESTLLPDPRYHGLTPIKRGVGGLKSTKIDVIFPVLHGPYGEDGTMQGLFELASIPYVGAGVLGSAVGMDKVIQKHILRQNGLPVVDYVWCTRTEWKNKKTSTLSAIRRKLRYPLFVKPANMGSSVGITKVHTRKELIPAIRLAFQYDRKVLVENGIEPNRDIEVSVLGNEQPNASVPGEIISSNEFYDYNAKYVNGRSKAIVPAKIPKALVNTIRNLAVQAFKLLDCSGMARVDFLVKGRKAWINELNTIPGFTSISMYPKLWKASGLPYSKLLDKLIRLAIERHHQINKLKTSYKPKKIGTDKKIKV